MFRASQSALQNYKMRRGGGRPARRSEAAPNSPLWTLLRILVPLALLALVLWAGYPRKETPMDLTYELDLSEARQGRLTITLIAEGKLPGELDLEFPPGVYAEDQDGVEIHPPQAHRLNPDGEAGALLAVSPTPDGWRLETQGADRVGVIYRVDLFQVTGQEQDIRRHISAPINGGLRAAGFEIFLEPVGQPAGNLTVAVHNPGELAFLVPWPALLRGGQSLPDTETRLAGKANVAFGMGYQPAEQVPAHPDSLRSAGRRTNHPVPTNLFYHPRDLADLNNSLVICGDIQTATSQARDTVIQFATDRQWLFPVDRAVDLVRRIARTQIGFFGDAPTSQITVMLAENAVTAAEGFDVYGLHTGASVLVMLDPQTTWEQLQENVSSVISHEMFHGWLGEAVRQTDPATLWFTEGATTWYAARMLTASGVWSPEHAREVLSSRLDRDYARNPLLGRMPIAEAAAEVMARAEQVRFAYAGGVAACVALDQWLGHKTGMMRPLDEVLRLLYAERGEEPLSRFRLEEALQKATGVDCSPWLDKHVYGKSALPPLDELI